MKTGQMGIMVVSIVMGIASVASTVSWARESGSLGSKQATHRYAMGRKPQTQKPTYRCPRCGMTYDKPGVCPMDNTKLEKVTIPSKAGSG